MHQAHIWPVVAWKFFQPDDPTVGIMSSEKAQAARNGQGVTSGSGFVVRYSTDLQGRAGLRVINGFHGREFGRLKPSHPCAIAACWIAERNLHLRMKANCCIHS